MFQATRRRLAFWYTAVTAVLLLLFASGFYFYVRSTLIERIDDTLNHVVEVVQRSLVIEPTNPHSEGGQLRINLEASFRSNPGTDEDDHIDLEWFNATGELLWSTLSESLNVPLNYNSNGQTVHLIDDQVLRQVTHRVQVGRQVLGYLRVSHPWFEVTKPIRELILELSLGTMLMIVAVAAIGWFLSGLAMEPVRESYQRLKQFTADASHELRNPIAMIQTNVQVALADPDPEPQMQQNQLKVIERLTRRLGRLVDDLLFLARQDSGMVQPRSEAVPLDALLIEVIEEQQAIAAEKQLTLTLDLMEPTTVHQEGRSRGVVATPAEEELLTLQGDWDQLARLCTNLVSNAVQYTPAGGQVQVSLQRIEQLGHAQLQVTVSDTGIGIPAEAIPRLFDRFYRVDPARSHQRSDGNSNAEIPTRSAGGSGLGLAIAQAIAENHRGQIRVESILHQGTRVIVCLPIGEMTERR